MQAFAPGLEGSRLGLEANFSTACDLLVGGMKVFKHNAPGNTVNAQVMDSDEESLGLTGAEIELDGAHDWRPIKTE
jgi:hypothetical protein